MRRVIYLVCLFFVISCENSYVDTPQGVLDEITYADDTVSAKGVDISFTTKSGNGSYAPKHTMVAWIEDRDGNVIKTLGRWAAQYVNTLSWRALSGVDSDVKTGATASSHGTTNLRWDFIDKNGKKIGEGDYTLNIEYNENNEVSKHKTSVTQITIADSVTIVSKGESSYIYDISFTE